MSDVNGTNGVEVNGTVQDDLNRVKELLKEKEVKPPVKPSGSRAQKQQAAETRLAGSRMLGLLHSRNSHEKNKGRRSVVTTDPDTGATVKLSVPFAAVTPKQWAAAAKKDGLTISVDDSEMEDVQLGADNDGLSYTRHGDDAEAFLKFVASECIPPSVLADDNDK